MVIDMYEHSLFNKEGNPVYRQITPYAEMSAYIDKVFVGVDNNVMNEIIEGKVIAYQVGGYRHEYGIRPEYKLHKNMYSMKVIDRLAPPDANGCVWQIGNFKEIFINLKPVFKYYNQLGEFNSAMKQLRELNTGKYVHMRTEEREIIINQYDPAIKDMH